MIEIDNLLLRTLYERKSLDIYAWHKEMCLSPICIAHAVLSLREKGILQLSENHEQAFLTDYGKKWTERHSKELFATKGDEPWKTIPKSMIQSGDSFFEDFFCSSDLQKLLYNINE